MKRSHIAVLCLALAGCGADSADKLGLNPTPTPQPSNPLQVGVAAVRLTPCGPNDDWDGPITANGVWGETYTDTNGNGRWDPREPYVNDPVNTQLDAGSTHKYDGIYLAGFGNDRIATGCHDDIWARALVLATPHHKVALVAVDFVGEVTHGSYYGFAQAQKLVDPSLGIDTILYASTHDHEAPDTLGLWGSEQFVDGKFPHYLQFVDKEVAKAINLAAAASALHPATVIAAHTTPAQDPTLLGLQVRTGCRPPWFFDDELRALQFVATDGSTIATLINWNTHPESLEDDNTLVSSDFPNFVRARVESQLGGTAVYFSGDLGAVEIVGDTCVGKADPRSPDGTNVFDHRQDPGFPVLGFARTQMIGETVGDATVRALQSGAHLNVAAVDTKGTEYYIAGSNPTFSFANQIGLLDLDQEVFNLAHCPPDTPDTSICVLVEQHLLTLLDASGQPQVQLVTAPGEIFPELYYGVEQHKRTDCDAANTGEPYEPSIRNAMTAPHRLLIGLSPDELGYIVPGYDFYAPPSITMEANDACAGHSYDPNFPARQSPSHYHESLSVGLDIAASTTCTALQLLGRDADVMSNAACRRALRLP